MHLSSAETIEVGRAFRKPSAIQLLTRREVGKYSFAREVLRILNGSDVQSFERDCTSLAYADPPLDIGNKIIVPPQILQRDLSTAIGAKGGYLTPVATDSAVGVIDALRPLSVVLRAGATELPSLVSNVAAPRQTTGVTATWVGEGVADVADDPAFEQLSIFARRIMAITVVSRQLITQAPRLLDRALVRELSAAIASALDLAALQGSGAVQPLGIVNTPNVPTVSGTSLGVTGLLAAQRTVINNNGLSDAGSFVYVTTPTVAETLSTRATLGAGTQPVWQGPLAEGAILGALAMSTPNCPTGTLIAGDFSRLLVATFDAGLEIAVSESPGFNAATVAFRALLRCDIVVAQTNAFVVSSSIT